MRLRVAGHTLRTNVVDAGYHEIVLLGATVWGAVFPDELGMAWCGALIWDGRSYYKVPHPSGLNRWYNSQARAREVGELLRRLVP